MSSDRTYPTQYTVMSSDRIHNGHDFRSECPIPPRAGLQKYDEAAMKFIEQECPTPTGRGGVGPTIILLEEYDEE